MTGDEIELKKPHFVLIQGLGGGSWCWYKVKCLMYSFGYTVTCIDLKGAGIDPYDPNKILSFNDYNKPLIKFLSSLPDREQVIIYYNIILIEYRKFVHVNEMIKIRVVNAGDFGRT